MRFIDLNEKEMKPHLHAAVREYAKNRDSYIVLKCLYDRGLKETEARLILKEAKRLLRGPARKRGLVRLVFGFVLFLLMMGLQPFFEEPIWFIGAVGALFVCLGGVDMIFGTTDPKEDCPNW